jgi:hypothetical protein
MRKISRMNHEAMRRAAPLAGLLFLLAACATVREPIEVPASMPALAEQIAPDVRLVTAAVVRRIRARPAASVEQDTGVRASRLITPEPRFDYRGFALRRVKYRGNTAPAGESGRRALSGYLHFRDEAGRNAAAVFETTYRTAAGGVTLETANWSPVYADHPEIEMFVVPADIVAETLGKKAATYAELYRKAGTFAVDLRDPGTRHGDARDYVIFVFVKDRIAPGGRVRVLVGPTRAATSGSDDFALQRRFDGWPVVILPGKFPLGAGGDFYVKVRLTPGGAASDGTERLVGLFSLAPE